ncbi:MAG: nucleotidyl transferase AbiEii/AbiGii toxin family protein, partial [Thermodesulfobacteriota bacterium]
IEQAIQAVFSREGFTTKKVPTEHAGGKWRLSYQSFSGQSSNLEVDVNFMFRQPLWDIRHNDAHHLGEYSASNIPVLDIHELFAGKLAALFARMQARDLFDCYQMFKLETLDIYRLRLAFVIYGGMNRKDWRSISTDDLDFEAEELAKQLIPTLHRQFRRDQNKAAEYGASLMQECKQGLFKVLPFTDVESQFLDLLLEHGKIDASLLTPDKTLQEHIQCQPLLQWKALNVRHHKGLS